MTEADHSLQARAVIAPDGYALSARFFEPEGEARAAVLIVPAMGCSQGYYESFARWLVEQGYLAATFDYRGVGQSRNGSLRGFEADLFDWARDCGAVLAELTRRASGKTIYWVGHSLGGQILPFVPGSERVAKVVTVAAGSGYWRENAAPLRRKVWWLWFVMVPLSMRLFGYYPGKRLRMVGDLPKGVMAQWRRRCLNGEYAVGVEGEAVREKYAAVRTPIVSLSFVDDEFMSARNIESLHGFYVNAPRTMKRIAPEDVGVHRIGHFGFFRSSFKDSLWRGYLLPELA
jgi:predicted alpha/beta hydrolase